MSTETGAATGTGTEPEDVSQPRAAAEPQAVPGGNAPLTEAPATPGTDATVMPRSADPATPGTPDDATAATAVDTADEVDPGSDHIQPWTPPPLTPPLTQPSSDAGAVTEAGAGEAPAPSAPAPADLGQDQSAEASASAAGAEGLPSGSTPPPAAEGAPVAEVAPVSEAAPDPTPAALAALHAAVQSLTAQVTGITETNSGIHEQLSELTRLRQRDGELVDRMHAEITRLRGGELAQAVTPVVLGMLKVHDQMVSLGALTDSNGIAGLLHAQLLQSLELTAGVTPFTPAAGDPFDAKQHTGVRRVATSEPAADGTVATTVKAGFIRADGSIVRAAEVEVHRLSG